MKIAAIPFFKTVCNKARSYTRKKCLNVGNDVKREVMGCLLKLDLLYLLNDGDTSTLLCSVVVNNELAS